MQALRFPLSMVDMSVSHFTLFVDARHVREHKNAHRHTKTHTNTHTHTAGGG
jgi:hypothetical protein